MRPEAILETGDGRPLAVKLQYPDMQSAVEADLAQLRLIFSIHKRMDPAIDTSEMASEIGARLREELDYALEARHMRLYAGIFADDDTIRIPDTVLDLSTKRLLTMTWLDGRRVTDYKLHPEEERNVIAHAMFRAWWYPFSHFGVIHGDPHLGNYTVRKDLAINLLDLAQRLMAGNVSNRPNNIRKKACIVPGECVNLTALLPEYRLSPKKTARLTTDLLANNLKRCIERVQHEQTQG